jgi:uncharacterized membrane-anchored protein
MSALASLMALLQTTTSTFNTAAQGTGLEWLTIAAVVVPAVLCAVLVYLGTKSTIR